MSADWRADKAQTDRVLPAVKRILGEHLISAAPFAEDAERNTDLIVLRLEAVRIGVRIRSARYFDRPAYRTQFTIRAGRPSGVKTELTKIVEGWGDYFFYGFANPTYTDLLGYTLGDLRVFRLWFNQQLARLAPGAYPGERHPNKDGSSFFYAYNIADLPAAFVIARAYPEAPHARP
jgi:hypothetical protein